MKDEIKKALLASRLGRAAYSRAHEIAFERSYRLRRERYQRIMGGDARAYDAATAFRDARGAIAKRGYSPSTRTVGDVHTFAFLPSHWWHQNQIAVALKSRGPLSRFDYTALGFQLADLRSRSAGNVAKRDQMLTLLMNAIREAHQLRPIDWFFAYSLGWDLTRDVVRRVQSEFGIPTVNISLDDKNWWEEIEPRDAASGLKNVVPAFDLGWTSTRVVLPWYRAEGGRAVFLPEGVNVDWFKPLDVDQDVDVGFVGSNFGYRRKIVETLARADIKVEVHGPNWPSGALSDQDMLKFFNRSRINLGLGDMHFSQTLTNLKGRDFEIPAVGRGIYLTAYNSELAACFGIGTEILCYRGIDELIELLRYYRLRPEICATMAASARERCIREHQWVHRIDVLLQGLGILAISPLYADALRRFGDCSTAESNWA